MNKNVIKFKKNSWNQFAFTCTLERFFKCMLRSHVIRISLLVDKTSWIIYKELELCKIKIHVKDFLRPQCSHISWIYFSCINLIWFLNAFRSANCVPHVSQENLHRDFGMWFVWNIKRFIEWLQIVIGRRSYLTFMWFTIFSLTFLTIPQKSHSKTALTGWLWNLILCFSRLFLLMSIPHSTQMILKMKVKKIKFSAFLHQ